jgi:hypothetical protein
MKALGNICWTVIALNFIAMTLFCSQQTTDRQLFSMATVAGVLFVLLISFVLGLRFCSRDKFRAFIPLAICVIGLPISWFVAGRLGEAIQDWRFKKNLPRYTEVVRLIEKGEIKVPSGSDMLQLPSQYSDLALRTFASTNSEGVVIVGFITGLGFPVKHSGLLYLSTGNIENSGMLLRWPRYRRLNENWFVIED